MTTYVDIQINTIDNGLSEHRYETDEIALKIARIRWMIEILDGNK
jgi:hypothetical protein